MMDKTREAAFEKYLDEYGRLGLVEDTMRKQAFDAGAASVDRVEIVREAFRGLHEHFSIYGEHGHYEISKDTIQEAMDAVLETIGEGK